MTINSNNPSFAVGPVVDDPLPSASADPLEPDLVLSAYDYELPPERIAQNPAVPRDSSRLLAVTSPTEQQHHRFYDLPNLLRPGDLLVLNDTRVIPARLYGQTGGGAQVEVLLLEEQDRERWLALVRPGKRLKPGTQIRFTANSDMAPTLDSDTHSMSQLDATVIETDKPTGGRIIQFHLPADRSLLQVIAPFGQVPLPPYITHSEAIAEQYQTVYARYDGSVAAPTAGLHVTPDLLTRLQEAGISHCFITLHVGVGTFRSVEVEDITTHTMHGEWLEVSPGLVAQIQATRAKGGRVMAVGTTVTRALEGAAQTGVLQPYCGKTELFIYPGYQWRVVDGLITNFHLPKSSLMMLVSALIGRKRLLALYQEAIAHQYRFYSFGDAMLILPEARIGYSGSSLR